MTITNRNTATIHTLSAPTPTDDYQSTAKDLMLFIVMVRRGIRRAVAVIDRQHATACQYRRQVRIIKERANPFDAARIASLEALVDAQDKAAEPMYASLKMSGQLLADVAPMIDAGTTLTQRCEILNVNIADRADLTDEDGIRRIVFAHRLEDSASSRGQDWKNGPLFQASHQVFMDFMLHTEVGKDLGDSLFQPGGLFADVPLYRQEADGTMKRLPPRLYSVPALDGETRASPAPD